jgi:hypothetical protein
MHAVVCVPVWRLATVTNKPSATALNRVVVQMRPVSIGMPVILLI